MNRQNYRYYPAAQPSLPSQPVYRTLESPPTGCVRVSWEDRSSFIKVTPDGLGLMGDKGFRSARCTTPIREGKWYFEVKIEKSVALDGDSAPSTISSGANVRLGWGRREASLNGPVGLDGYSYGIRDRTGEKVTLSRPRPYGRPFGTGNVVGLYISLPPHRKPNPSDSLDPARIVRKRIPIHFKGQLYFESMEPIQSKEMNALMDYSGKQEAPETATPSAITSKSSTKLTNSSDRAGPTKKQPPGPAPPQTRSLPILKDSAIAFFVNGECQDMAFKDIYSYLQLRPSKATSTRGAGGSRRNAEDFKKERENPFDDGTLGYYPFISIFGSAQVRINPGPEFDYPPPPDIDAILSPNRGAVALDGQQTWRPLCERAAEFAAEIRTLDDKEEANAAAAQNAEQDAEKIKAEKDKRRKERDAERRRRKIAEGAKQKALDQKESFVGAPDPVRTTSASSIFLEHIFFLN